VEHASRECFKDGGALAEVMSLFEVMSEDSLADHPKQNTEVAEQGSHHLTIEVWYYLHFFLHAPSYIEPLFFDKYQAI